MHNGRKNPVVMWLFLHVTGRGAELAAWAAAALPRVPMPHGTSGYEPDSPVKAARLKEFNPVFMIMWNGNRSVYVYPALILRIVLRILGGLWYSRLLPCGQRGILNTWFLWQELQPWTVHSGAEEKEVVGEMLWTNHNPQPYSCGEGEVGEEKEDGMCFNFFIFLTIKPTIICS